MWLIFEIPLEPALWGHSVMCDWAKRSNLENLGNLSAYIGWSRIWRTSTPSALSIQNWRAPPPTEPGLNICCVMTARFQLCEKCPRQCLAFSNWELIIDHKFKCSPFLRNQECRCLSTTLNKVRFLFLHVTFSHHLPGKWVILCILYLLYLIIMWSDNNYVNNWVRLSFVWK